VTSWEVVSDADAGYAFITQHYDIGRTQQFRAICNKRDGEIVAAVGYDECNGSNIFCHIASDGSKRWMTRHYLHEIFKFPFVTIGCERITLWIDAANIPSLVFVTNLGFRREAVLEKAGRDGHDVLIYRMFRRECRYA
jgi:RimJ/RimL family protein N-acetyltransferase